MRKLQLGSGYHPIGGWLNSDYLPQSSDVIRLDATGVYPFGDETFDYVFSEHMIEHVAHEKGQRMLRECFRILKVGGTIRISTPDLAFLIALYSDDKTELQCQYIRWSTNKFIGYAPKQEDTYVINNFVRDWGHSFIYDEKILRFSLEDAGFANITRCDLSKSEHAALADMENEQRMPDGFLRLESLILEGTKVP